MRKNERPRTCWDLWRYRFRRAQRVRREMPAASAVAQLLAVFTVLVSALPPTSAPAQPVTSGPSESMIRRRERAIALGVPVRYVDAVREAGVPYDILFRDLHGRFASKVQADALAVLRQQVPEAASWIAERGKWAEWSAIKLCRGINDADTRARIVAAASRWKAAIEMENDEVAEFRPGDGFRP